MIWNWDDEEDLEIDVDDDWDETDPPIDVLEGEDDYVEL